MSTHPNSWSAIPKVGRPVTESPPRLGGPGPRRGRRGAEGADVVADFLGEPDPIVGARGDAPRVAVRGGDGVLGDGSPGGDPRDVAALLSAREAAVGAGGHATGVAVRGRGGGLGNGPPGGDPPDVVAILLGEPQIAVGARGDAERAAADRRDGVLGDGPPGGDPPD